MVFDDDVDVLTTGWPSGRWRRATRPIATPARERSRFDVRRAIVAVIFAERALDLRPIALQVALPGVADAPIVAAQIAQRRHIDTGYRSHHEPELRSKRFGELSSSIRGI